MAAKIEGARTDDLDLELDRKLDNLSAKRGLPSLVKPSDDSKPARKAKAGDDMPAPTVNKTMGLPDYVVDELAVLTAKEKCSATYIILKALHDTGVIQVRPADMVKDKRRKGG